MSKQTLNSAIRKLEAAGFLYLEPGDGRGKNIRLTCSGKQCMETTARRLSEAEQRVFSNWEEEDRAAYARLLEKHLQDFQKELTSL
jgi:DNA-binding MarR family transcriptional regulator